MNNKPLIDELLEKQIYNPTAYNPNNHGYDIYSQEDKDDFWDLIWVFILLFCFITSVGSGIIIFLENNILWSIGFIPMAAFLVFISYNSIKEKIKIIIDKKTKKS